LYKFTDFRYERVIDIKKQNPKLKVLLSVGGPATPMKAICTMLKSRSKRRTFVKSCITFLRGRNFDGLSLDFKYTGSCGSSYKKGFASLISVSVS